MYRVFPTWGVPLASQKFAHSILPAKFLFPPHQNSIQPNKKNKTVIFSCRNCSCTIFALIPYSFQTQVILILILIDVLQNTVFSLKIFSNRQNHSFLGSRHLVKKIPPSSVHYFLTQSQRNSYSFRRKRTVTLY